MARLDLVAMATLVLLFAGQMCVSIAAASMKAPNPTSLSFPPFSSSNLLCQFDKSVNLAPEFICVPSRPPAYILFSDDVEQISVRYQYKKPVQLWKKGSPYVASFSTQFTINVDKDIESYHEGVFGGGFTFAITPSIDVADSNLESLGLFKIDPATGNPVSVKNPHTVAVEIDTSRDTLSTWDPEVPHIGLDINSVKSVASRFLWDGVDFIGRKIAVFIDYDAVRESIAVRLQNVSALGVADKAKSVLYLSYSGFNLAKYIKEQSYVGFSSRVPVTDDGVYILYDWKFTTKWVLKY